MYERAIQRQKESKRERESETSKMYYGEAKMERITKRRFNSFSTPTVYAAVGCMN